MDIFEALMQEHEEVKQMMEQMSDMKRGPTKKRDEMYTKLRAALDVHMKFEEKNVYPLLQEDKKTKEHAFEGVEEHEAAKFVFKRLDKMDDGDERWSAHFKVAKEMIEHHIEEEEGQLFPDGREVIAKDKAKKLGEQYEGMKEKEMNKAREKAMA